MWNKTLISIIQQNKNRMDNYIQRTTLIAGMVIFSTISFAQKKNETSAAVEFKNNFQSAMGAQDYEKAKLALTSAKGFIDLAAEHPETKESPKTLWLKGEIYSNIIALGQQTKDSSFTKLAGANGIDVAVESFKKSFQISDKFDDDIRQSIYQKHEMLEVMANGYYNNKLFKEAGMVYQIEAKLYDAINETDTNAIFNSSLSFDQAKDYGTAAQGYTKLARLGYRSGTCYTLASIAYRKNNQLDEAKAILTEGRAKFPLDKDMILEMVNTSIDAKDPEGAEKALTDAINGDPTNKQLHYIIGTVYTELKQNEKAEKSLNKALEIDPNYHEAQYQLGAHLVSWSNQLSSEANKLKVGDKNYDVLVKQSTDILNRALSPLEKYLEAEPNNKDVLVILYKIQRNLGNTEKAAEYKKRADEVKQ